MLKQDKPPFPFSMINAGVGLINRLGIKYPALTADDIKHRAEKATGLTDFGDPHYMEGLEVLLADARTAAMNPFGRLTVHLQAIAYAQTRLEWVEVQKQQPAAFATPLQPPLIVLGWPRSGTTVLHRLLAADPAHQAIPAWRLIKPFPPLDGRPDKRHRFVAQQMKMLNQLKPALASKHLITADTPEECMTAQGMSFNSIVFYASAPLFEYMEWHLQADLSKMYAEYASLLRWYQAADARRLVLKSPSHTPALRELLTAVPNAMIVHIHRDPVKVTNSLNSLFHTNHSCLMRPYMPPKMVDCNLQMLDSLMQRNMAARDDAAIKHTICDVYHDDLVADPIGTAQKIYTHFGLTWTDDTAANLQQYMTDNPRHKHGAHRYSAADFGLTDAQIRERFAPYIERFGLSQGDK